MEWLGVTKIELSKCDNYNVPPLRQLFCYEENKIYNSVSEFAEAHNYKSNIHIYRACNHVIDRTVMKMHVFWYDEYIKMNNEEVMSYVNNTAKIITLSEYNRKKEDGKYHGFIGKNSGDDL